MTTASPTLEGDGKRFGVPVSRLDYPPGVAGVHLSLTEVARRIYEGMRAPSIQQFAEMVVRNWAQVPVQDKLSNRRATQIFLDFVRASVRYRPDPPNIELTKSATISLCVPGGAMCIPVGDCDDLVVALGSLTSAYGIPTHVVKQTFGSEDQEHVLIEIQDDDGTWLPADPSAGPDKPVGWKADATHEDVIDPSDPKSIQLVGAHEAEFIGVGSLSRGGIRVFIGSPNPYAARIGMGRPIGMGLVTRDDVTRLDQQLDPQFDALDLSVRACPKLSQSDSMAWAGVYTSWKTLHARWAEFNDPPWWNFSLPLLIPLVASGILDEMHGYQTALQTWQERVHLACANYVPPPGVVVPPPQAPSGTTGALEGFAKATAGVASVIVAGTVAYVVVDALGWIKTFKPKKA